tara:strand:+ start:3529 stop:4620 length:1092 start_codon:yes stop_codon:yes gene_type:complete
MTKLYILNQYYIDLIKKLKTITKKHKDKSETAKRVFNIIKNNYLTLDKNSDEYITFIKKHLTEELYISYKKLIFNTEKKNEENTEENTKVNDDISSWLTLNQDVQILDNISIKDILKIFRNEYLCHHYLSVFFIYTQEITDEESEKILAILQKDNFTDDDINELVDENDFYKKILLNLIEIKNIKIKKNVDMKMGGMENTTLGKLAKEILEDVDVNKLQKSMDQNGDVLKSLGDPDSGFGDIISNVSQKMAAKLSSGELNQENLMQDAMKFASMMPGMFGNQNNMGKNNNMGNNNMANMGNMMSMFSEMMANNNGEGDMPDLNTIKSMAKNKKGGRSAVNEGAYKKLAAQKKLRKKLAEKNKN